MKGNIFSGTEILIKRGRINNEFELELAKAWARKLKVFDFSRTAITLRKKLKGIICDYEKEKWKNSDKVSKEQIYWNDLAEEMVNTYYFSKKKTEILK